MHHGHSLSTGENVLPPLSDFTIVLHTLNPATISFLDWAERVGLPNSAWMVDFDQALIRVKHPAPTDAIVQQKYYRIEWDADF